MVFSYYGYYYPSLRSKSNKTYSSRLMFKNTWFKIMFNDVILIYRHLLDIDPLSVVNP